MAGPSQNPVSSLLRRLWRYLLKYRGMTACVILLGVAEAAFTKAPLALAKVVMDLLFPGAPVHGEPPRGPDWLMRQVVAVKDLVLGPGEIAREDKLGVLITCAVIMACLALLGAVAMGLFSFLSRYLATRLVMDLKQEVIGHMVTLSLRFYSGRRMGDLLSRVTNDTSTTMQAFALTFENVVLDPLMILGSIGLLAIVHPLLAVAALVLVPAMGIPLITMGRGVRRSSVKSLKAMGESTEAVTQMLSGIRTVKAFGLEEQQLAQFAAANERFLGRTRQLLRRRSIAQAFTFTGYSLGLAGLILGGGYFALVEGIEAGALTLTLIGLSTIYPNIKRLSRAWQVFQESAGALDRLEEILSLENDLPDRPGAVASGRIAGRVEFDRVSFAYEDQPVLREVSFRVEPGQTVALVGPSGAGSSTTLDLIARFHDPVLGVVRVDDHDLRDLKISFYRRHLAVVSQEPFLFNASIEENIKHGRLGATRAEVEAAARAANIHDFVQGLSEGYATLVGERGGRLSGGQLQRITIARAILKDAPILLLDEATSSLDSESEDLVQRALQNLMQGRTCFIIAHRLATVRRAHRILVMDSGRIVQDGTHEELLAAGGLYRRLHELQDLSDARSVPTDQPSG